MVRMVYLDLKGPKPNLYTELRVADHHAGDEVNWDPAQQWAEIIARGVSCRDPKAHHRQELCERHTKAYFCLIITHIRAGTLSA